jgi:hypothetical protein
MTRHCAARSPAPRGFNPGGHPFLMMTGEGMNAASRGYQGYAIFTPRPKPFLIRVAPLALAWLALTGVGFVVMVLLNSTGTLSLGGVPVDRTQFLIRVLPALLLDCGGQVVLAYGLLQERRWARPLAVWLGLGSMVLVVLAVVPGMAVAVAAEHLPYRLALTLVAYWYFYRKPSVVQYYSGLEHRSGIR